MRASRIVTRRAWIFGALLPLLLALGGGTAHADSALFQARYIAGSVHVDVGMPPAEEALGPVDCGGLVPSGSVGGTAGGVCFDLSGFVAGSHQFILFADDNVSRHVSLFGGFDTDGDGCVGCAPGADAAWEGIDLLGGRVSKPGLLAVFVRAVSIDEEDGPHLATSGMLSLFVFDASPSDPGICERGPAEKSPCHRFGDELPYPYPCLPDCKP